MSIRKLKKAIKRCIKNNDFFSLRVKFSGVFCTNEEDNIEFKKNKLLINGTSIPYSQISSIIING